MVTAAQNLKDARETLRQAERLGDSELLKSAQAALAKTTAEWNAINKLAHDLDSHTYQTYLARNMTGADERYDRARDELHRKTAQFTQLERLLGERRDKALEEMRSELETETKERRSLLINSTFGFLEAGTEESAKLIRLTKLGTGAGAEALIQNLERFNLLMQGKKVGYEVHAG